MTHRIVLTQPERTSVCSLGFDTPTKPTKAAQRLRTSRLKPQTKLESWHNRGSVKTSHTCLKLPAVITGGLLLKSLAELLLFILKKGPQI